MEVLRALPSRRFQLALCILVLAGPCRASFGQGAGIVTLECKSDNFRRSVCSAGAPIQRIRLIELKSNTACIEGENFGFSGNSIWVDKGCAAKFEVTLRGQSRSIDSDRRGDTRDRTRTEVTTVRCSSDKFGRTDCRINGTVRSVTVQRQRSQARCQEGVSFGYRGNIVWVDKGCDADFEVRFLPRSEDRSRTVRFTCKSDKFGLGVCYTPGPILDLRLVQRKSRAACTNNKSYGFRNDALWVKDGCEADFEVTYRPETNSEWRPSNSTARSQFLVCKSDQYRRETCRVEGVISDVRLRNTRSRAACRANSSYGFNLDEIWVKDGCEGEFEVIYHPRPARN